MKISKLMNGVAATALSSVLALGQMGSAQADDAAPGQQQQAQPVSTQQVELTSTQMRDLANNYSKGDMNVEESKRVPRVGIFLNIAPDTRLAPQQLGAAMVKKFAEHGIEAQYIFNYARAGVSSTTYYVGGYVAGEGSYDFGLAEEGFNEALGVYRGLKAERQLSGTPQVEDNLALNN